MSKIFIGKNKYDLNESIFEINPDISLHYVLFSNSIISILYEYGFNGLYKNGTNINLQPKPICIIWMLNVSTVLLFSIWFFYRKICI